jgi:hypothetical protein
VAQQQSLPSDPVTPGGSDGGWCACGAVGYPVMRAPGFWAGSGRAGVWCSCRRCHQVWARRRRIGCQARRRRCGGYWGAPGRPGQVAELRQALEIFQKIGAAETAGVSAELDAATEAQPAERSGP